MHVLPRPLRDRNAVVALLVLSSVSLLVVPAVGADWTTHLGDDKNTGTADKAPVGNLSVVWTREPTGDFNASFGYGVTGDNGSFTSSPAVSDETAYIGVMTGVTIPRMRADADRDGEFLAMNLTTGETTWRNKVQGGVFSTPTYEEGVVYTSTTGGMVYAFDADDGKNVWKSDLGSPIYSSPTVSDGGIYLGTRPFNTHNLSDGKFRFYRLNKTDGMVEWKKEVEQGVTGTPAVDKKNVYYGDHKGTLYAVSKETGKSRWEYSSDFHENEDDPLVRNGGFLSPPAISKGDIYVGSYDGYVHSVNLSTGTKNWVKNTNPRLISSIVSSPAVDNGTVYVGSYDNNLYAFNRTTGKKKWSFRARNRLSKSSPVVSNGNVYVGGVNGSLYSVNSSDGSFAWSFSAGNPIWSSVTITGKYVLFSTFERLYSTTEGNTSKWVNKNADYLLDNTVNERELTERDTSGIIRSNTNQRRVNSGADVTANYTYIFVVLFVLLFIYIHTKRQ